MKRNRSIRTLPLDNLNLLKRNLPETSKCHNEKLYFGEEVFKGIPPCLEKDNLLSSDESDIILTSVKDFDNSSSSSLSWGEEYKSEASRQIRDELERMDRVLRGVEPIPSNYDAEEYTEWMDFFPNLCVVGIKTEICTEKVEKCTDNEEVLVIHPVDCDKIEPSNHINKAVMTICAPKLTDESIDIDDFLKVSHLEGPKLTRRQSSSRSLISSQISSSKWMKDEDYNSLPFVATVKRNGVPKGILKNSLVLPPIETNQFRSISATPRRQSKSLSALSVKYSGFKRKDLCK